MGKHYRGGAGDGRLAPDLIRSYRSVYALANYLDYNGVGVRVPALNSLEEAVSPDLVWSDGGNDLMAYFDGEWRKIESKHRLKMTFTTVDEFPFPDIMVDVAHKIEEFGPAFRYAFTNRDLTHGLALDGHTHDQWTKRVGYDGRLDRQRKYYYADKDLLRCRDIRVPKDSIIPQWVIRPNGHGTTQADANPIQVRIFDFDPFDGKKIAPVCKVAIDLGFHPTLIPIRVGRWDHGAWQRVESESPWPTDTE